MTLLRDIAHRLPADLLSAFALLSRLPLPDHRGTGAASAWAWPLVGAVLGALGAALAASAQWLGVTPGVTAALVLGLAAMLTGGLHEDGLSDSADGLYGGWTRERRLAIMKDSRVGSYGVLALVLVTLARWSALTALLVHGAYGPALIAAGAMSRAPMALVMSLLPNARTEGLSHATGRPGPATALTGLVLALAIAAVLTGWSVVPMTFAALAVTLWLALSALRRIGGQTGDILGATQQLAELACLTVLSVRA
ncbi:adenosylcobinamide-GDP ribazoletransferase [Rhodobacter calidifons]|uniref:adenosylcobinamide-GDP ribazoletransferase n=1 Tax=Rhodobacter calidifons TaxID=2715277 RepID=UPI001F60470A|nr:adenosylcobinamide-GDP ribazoletransferase [Rhodobacter calidifons]